jgi:hypothetical protein
MNITKDHGILGAINSARHSGGLADRVVTAIRAAKNQLGAASGDLGKTLAKVYNESPASTNPKEDVVLLEFLSSLLDSPLIRELFRLAGINIPARKAA